MPFPSASCPRDVPLAEVVREVRGRAAVEAELGRRGGVLVRLVARMGLGARALGVALADVDGLGVS